PQSPTRTTKNSILKLAGAFHCPNTSRIRFWAFSYSAGEPCGRSFQLITYFISSPFYDKWSERSEPLESTPRRLPELGRRWNARRVALFARPLLLSRKCHPNKKSGPQAAPVSM